VIGHIALHLALLSSQNFLQSDRQRADSTSGDAVYRVRARRRHANRCRRKKASRMAGPTAKITGKIPRMKPENDPRLGHFYGFVRSALSIHPTRKSNRSTGLDQTSLVQAGCEHQITRRRLEIPLARVQLQLHLSWRPDSSRRQSASRCFCSLSQHLGAPHSIERPVECRPLCSRGAGYTWSSSYRQARYLLPARCGHRAAPGKARYEAGTNGGRQKLVWRRKRMRRASLMGQGDSVACPW